MEGDRRFRCLLWKVLEGDGNGRKHREGSRSIKKHLVSTSMYVARYEVIDHRKESAVWK